jgi:FkbM family methyltransferase
VPELFFRPRTWDEGIWQAVAGSNEYGLPPRFEPGSTVIDVGAHIGAFSYAVLDRGASLVVALEADAENARIWQHNLHRACKAADRSVLLTAACWRSDRPGPQWLRISAVDANTGGSHVFGKSGLPVRAIGLDTVIDLALALAPGRIRLLKLDCEGSEWPTLCTSSKLDLVDEIVGEYHQASGDFDWGGPATIAELLAVFGQAGFQTRSTVTDPRGLGLFHAWRDTPACQLPRSA